MAKVLCVFPDDPSTRFLEKLSNRLNMFLVQDFHCFKVKATKKSHESCLTRIKTGKEELIIFLGHGKSTEIFGANTSESLFERGHLNTEGAKFIFKDNIDVLKGKKVFCLSCNSNENLSKWAIESGSVTFLGFGDIPQGKRIKI